MGMTIVQKNNSALHKYRTEQMNLLEIQRKADDAMRKEKMALLLQTVEHIGNVSMDKMQCIYAMAIYKKCGYSAVEACGVLGISIGRMYRFIHTAKDVYKIEV